MLSDSIHNVCRSFYQDTGKKLVLPPHLFKLLNPEHRDYAIEAKKIAE